MSGGHFNHSQYVMTDIADSIETAIYANFATKPETVTRFQEAVSLLRRAEVYAQRIDWFLSDDDSEETFHARLENDLIHLERGEPQPQ